MFEVLYIALFAVAVYFYSTRQICAYANKNHIVLLSIPRYYGYFSVIYSSAFLLLFAILLNYLQLENWKIFLFFFFASIFSFFIVNKVNKYNYHARNILEKTFKMLVIFASLIAVGITIYIAFTLFWESLKFFKLIPMKNFLFGLKWNPEIADVNNPEYFGIVPLITGTMLVTGVAMLVSVPLGLYSAIYLSEYASKFSRNNIKPILELLAGIPTVIYGYFSALIVGPAVRKIGEFLSLNVTSESALAAGFVMGVMIIPYMMSLSDDVMHAVPQNLRDGAYALGSTKEETIKKVVIPAALPGIIGAFLLSVSRAIGETMIVTMSAGLMATLTANPLNSATTITVQIMTILLGDQEFDHPKTLSTFALGLVLFIITLILNIIALIVVKKYREKYE